MMTIGVAGMRNNNFSGRSLLFWTALVLLVPVQVWSWTIATITSSTLTSPSSTRRTHPTRLGVFLFANLGIKTKRRRGSVQLRSSTNNGDDSFSSDGRPGIFFGPEEEFSCPDEDECEIDWDAMPGFGSSDTNSSDNGDGGDGTGAANVEQGRGQKQTAINSSHDKDDKNNIANLGFVDDESDIDLQPRRSFGEFGSSQKDTKTAALHLEMNFQMDECVTDEESCSDFCPDCAGSGVTVCKFCRGTKVIAFGGDFRSCMLCHEDGQVECPTCRGTGQISPWAKTHNHYMNHHPH